MTKRDQEAAMLTAVLARYTPRESFSSREVASDALELIRAGRDLKRLGIRNLNTKLTEREKALDQALEESAKIVAAKYGAAAITDGDPRGYVLKLRFKDGERHNDLGGEGLWCLG